MSGYLEIFVNNVRNVKKKIMWIKRYEETESMNNIRLLEEFLEKYK